MSADNTRPLPQAEHAEASVISAILQEPHLLDVGRGLLTPEDFTAPRHARIWRWYCRASDAGRSPDLYQLADAIGDSGLDIATLSEMASKTINHLKFDHWCQEVADASARRKILARTFEIHKAAYDPEARAAELAEQLQAAAREATGHTLRSRGVDARTLAASGADRLHGLLSADRAIIGPETGLRELDLLLRGLAPGDLIILAARPSVGKTALAQSIAGHVCSRGGSVGWWSGEMTSAVVAQRWIQQQARVKIDGAWTRAEIDRAQKAGDDISGWRLIVDDSPASIAQIRMLALLWRDQLDGLDLLVIDYIGLVKPPRLGKNTIRENEVAYISAACKQLARDLDCAVLVLSQLNRMAAGTTPQLHHLRESGAIEQDADAVLMLHRELRSEDDTNGDHTMPQTARCFLRKNRHGPIGACELDYLAAYTLFERRSYDSPPSP